MPGLIIQQEVNPFDIRRGPPNIHVSHRLARIEQGRMAHSQRVLRHILSHMNEVEAGVQYHIVGDLARFYTYDEQRAELISHHISDHDQQMFERQIYIPPMSGARALVFDDDLPF